MFLLLNAICNTYQAPLCKGSWIGVAKTEGLLFGNIKTIPPPLKRSSSLYTREALLAAFCAAYLAKHSRIARLCITNALWRACIGVFFKRERPLKCFSFFWQQKDIKKYIKTGGHRDPPLQIKYDKIV